MVDFSSHAHPHFRDDSATAHLYLEDATRAAHCASSAKPCQRRKSGRDSWSSIVSKHADKDKWDR